MSLVQSFALFCLASLGAPKHLQLWTPIHFLVADIANSFSAMTNEEFEAEYDFKRPDKNAPKMLVFSCKSGLRASSAADQVLNCGYENIGVYKGSFDEWKGKNGKFISGDLDQKNVIGREEMKNGLGDGSLLVIDVRNRNERENPGHIPATKNVPRKVSWVYFKKHCVK